MKTRARRAGVLIFAIVCLVTLTLGACGDTSGGSDAGAPAGSSAGSGGSSAPEADGEDSGETYKIGYVLPISGPLGSLSLGGKGSEFVMQEALKVINDEQGGIELDGKKVKLEVVWGDSESDPTKAQEISTKLVTQDKVDMLLGIWTPDTVGPVSAVAERNQIPTVVAVGPDNSWLPGGPYDWSFGLAFNYDKWIDEYFNGWDKMETNKKIGLILDSSVDSVGMADLITAKAPDRGYEIVDTGRYPQGTTDFMQMLTTIQNAGCDILVASSVTPELVTLVNQSKQLGYIPKVVLMSKGMHMSNDVLALGDNGEGTGITIETMWSPQFPWVNSITGQDAVELSGAYEEGTGYAADLGLGLEWSMIEVAYDALTRAGTRDKEAIRQALSETNIETVYGQTSFNEENVGYVPIVYGQWIPDEKWGYRKVILSAETAPDVKEITAPIYIEGYNSSK